MAKIDVVKVEYSQEFMAKTEVVKSRVQSRIHGKNSGGKKQRIIKNS